MKNKQKNKTIQNIAGEILLYFYILYRKKPEELEKQNFDFSTRNGIYLNDRVENNELSDKYSEIDLYNALKYLKNKKFVLFAGHGEDMGGEIFSVLSLTDLGVDIIEDVKKDNHDENKFTKIFNIKINFDSFIKIENNFDIESIIKNSII